MFKRCISFGMVMIGLAAGALAQGPLMPAGGPQPVMKSLDQVEARIPIVSVPTNITAAGSYYLTGNFTYGGVGGAIRIQTNNVSLDLNGFTITSLPSAPDFSSGVRIDSSVSNIRVRNGMIAGQTTVTRSFNGTNYVWDVTPGGFYYGVDSLSTRSNILIEDLIVSGCRSVGINCSDGVAVRRCSVSRCGFTGIGAPGAVIEDCFTFLNAGDGIFAASYSLVKNCLSRLNGGDGIDAALDSLVVDCLESFNGL